MSNLTPKRQTGRGGCEDILKLQNGDRSMLMIRTFIYGRLISRTFIKGKKKLSTIDKHFRGGEVREAEIKSGRDGRISYGFMNLNNLI